MKKKYIVIIVLLLLIVAAFFVYKGVNLFLYDIKRITTVDYYDKISRDFKIKDTKTINTISNPNEEYLTFNNIKVQNYFKDFKKLEYPESTDKFNKYVLYDNNNEVVASFWMGVAEDTYINMFSYPTEAYNLGDEKFIKINRDDILKKHNIKNDIEFLEYLIETKENKNNIFTNIEKMKENYALQVFTSIVIPMGESISLINGDYIGYIFNLSNGKEYNILYNGKRYVFTFLELEYFNEEKIMEILNTVVIE